MPSMEATGYYSKLRCGLANNQLTRRQFAVFDMPKEHNNRCLKLMLQIFQLYTQEPSERVAMVEQKGFTNLLTE